MTDKPSRNELEYFQLRESEILRRKHREAERAQAERERQKHFRKCPRCGGDMISELAGKIGFDRCADCRGVFLEAAAAETLIKVEQGTAARIFNSMIRGVRSS
jgi:ssDNA-binding Zn-finger/Zn-ribbon topoisomerase 1